MGRPQSGSMTVPGLLLALLLALAVVSAVSLRLEPDSRREKQLDERGHRERESEVGRRREAVDEDRRRDVQHRHREENDDERRRDIERRRRDDEEDRAERRREVERRRGSDDEERRREEDDERRRDDDEERRREVERRRRDDDDEGRRREVEHRRREGVDDERRRDVERRREDQEDERQRREADRRRRDDDDDERRRESDRRRRDDDDDRRRDRRGRLQGEKGLLLEEPEKQLSTEGGEIRVWPQIRPLEDSDVYCQGARMTLRERGMLLPQYADSASICYVEEGEGLVGLLSGYSLGEKARRVRRGDVVAIPKGIAQWWYNSGNQDLRIIAFADTSFAIHGDRDYTPFALVGGRGEGEHGEREEELGSILHGFRKEFLAEAWDADESEVDEVLYSQKGVGIIKVERDVDIERAVNVIDESDIIGTTNDAQGRMQVHSHLSEFVYNVRHGTPDVMVEDAGFFNAANRMKLPLLSSVRLGLTHGRLQRNAIFAPHWSPNGHQVVHILRGTAYFEVAGPGGIKLLNQKVQEGDVIVIPRFHAAGMRAEDELEWVTFYTTDMPYVEALAGKTSVYKNLPTQVAAAAFNLDEDRVREFKKHRLRDALLLPSHGSQEVRHRRDLL